MLSEDADKNMFVKDKHCKANDEHCKANEHPVCFVGDENLKAYATGYRIGYKVGYKVGWQGGDEAYLGARQENDNKKDDATSISTMYFREGYQIGLDEGCRGHAGYQERMIKQISKNDNDDKNDDKKKEDEASPVHIWPSWVHCAVCRNETEFEDTPKKTQAWICGTCGASISWGPLPGKTAEEDRHMCTIIVDMNNDTNDNTKDDAARNAAALGPKDA